MPFPLLIPVVLGLASAALGAAGVKKGLDAKKDFERAKSMGERAESKYERAKGSLEDARYNTEHNLEALGELKVRVFQEQIGYLVDVLKKGRSSLHGFNAQISLTPDELQAFETDLVKASDLTASVGTAAASGTMAGLGAYGLVGMVGVASTGTAIGTLSGAAATNATLAWLGGGSLAAGGLGMAAGTWVLGGIIAGPALAIGGYALADQAEEALTKAREYKAEVEVACESMRAVRDVLEGIDRNVQEMSDTVMQMVERFERVKTDDVNDFEGLARMIQLGRALRELLNIPVLGENGAAAEGLSLHISGTLEKVGVEAA